MTIRLKRAYDEPATRDGFRILVERLWPRGIRKDAAAIDLWAKEVAPSATLRKWFDHEPDRWNEFKRRYYAELDRNRDAVDAIAKLARDGPVTFVFGSKETRFNNAVALKEYVERFETP